MNCKEVSEGLIAYFDGRADTRQRQKVEDHLAACSDCRARAEQFRAMWSVLDEMPLIEPTFGFDARVRQRVAAEPTRRWLGWNFGWEIPQPWLVLSAVLLAVLAVWMVKGWPMQQGQPGATAVIDQESQIQQEDFNVIKNLDVLENYDVVTGMDALSELVPPNAPGADGTQQN